MSFRPNPSRKNSHDKPRLRHRAAKLFPPGEVIPYLIVGVFNTIFGYATYATLLYLFTRAAPDHTLGLLVTPAKLAIAASVVSTPLNITVAYLNYKLFVFRTKGNYLREWLKAFSVYGVSTLLGLLVLSTLTHILAAALHGHTPFGKATPGYLAGAVMTFATTLISFIGHKKVTFGGAPGEDEDDAASQAAAG